MSDAGTTLRLLQVADSLFPSGAFAFSGGLETLAEDGLVRGADALGAVLAHQILPRWAGIDRHFLAAAQAAADDLDTLTALDADCEAHVTVAEAGEASRRTGAALLLTHTRIATPGAEAYRARVASGAPGHAAVVQGFVAARFGLPRAEAEAGSLYGAVQSSLSAAVRLGIVGALGAQRLLAELRPAMAAALRAPPPPLPAALTPFADIALARHAATPGRLFAS
ncbi:urease accessory protein UreF [Acuticoccus sp. I52.16.1]|uniref:urease accessory protein UreF n=1 Tax=Acuticoccus sp. I52.16.1 TaxID=2928472 RepID=UPI001FD22326|nr:urease accessory UreF family protein [Acuticoccus sp. I52.16.1]UOM34167.1 urease accessory protein UreF [Acuticoccus sp. I52.16.1]